MSAVDLHAHLVPADVLTRKGWLRLEGGRTAMQIGTHWQPVPDALVQPEALFTGPESEGIGVRVVSLPPFLLRYDLGPDDAAAYSRAVNDGLAALARRFEGRLRLLATVPMQVPRAAADELRRVVSTLGCDGVEIASSVGGAVDLDDPLLEPFWQAASDLRALVLIHPHDVAGADRMQRYHLRNLIGNPAETALAAARLIFGRVLERHRDVRVLLAHGGGALPWLAGRLDRGFHVRPECREPAQPPAEYLRRFLYDSVVHSPEILRALVDRVGADRVVLGTDFPFDMGDPHAVATVVRGVGDADARGAILEGNAARLLAPAGPRA